MISFQFNSSPASISSSLETFEKFKSTCGSPNNFPLTYGNSSNHSSLPLRANSLISKIANSSFMTSLKFEPSSSVLVFRTFVKEPLFIIPVSSANNKNSTRIRNRLNACSLASGLSFATTSYNFAKRSAALRSAGFSA